MQGELDSRAEENAELKDNNGHLTATLTELQLKFKSCQQAADVERSERESLGDIQRQVDIL